MESSEKLLDVYSLFKCMHANVCVQERGMMVRCIMAADRSRVAAGGSEGENDPASVMTVPPRDREGFVLLSALY